MREVLLVRFGEVHLKGQNRPYFLKTLTENVRRAVKPLGGQVWLADSRIYVDGVEDMRACGERVRRVFGVYSVSPAWELPKEFDVIAAVVVGGTALSGGRGSLFGTLLGVLVITLIGNGLVLLGINSFFQQVVRGVIIVVAVLANILLTQRSSKAKR